MSFKIPPVVERERKRGVSMHLVTSMGGDGISL